MGWSGAAIEGSGRAKPPRWYSGTIVRAGSRITTEVSAGFWRWLGRLTIIYVVTKG